MPVGGIAGMLPPQLTHEAVRLVFEMIGQLHAVTVNRHGVLFALAASPQLAERLAVFGARYEDDEPECQAEDDDRLSPAVVEVLLAPAPLQGHPVPAWTPPGRENPAELLSEVSRYWPDLVRPPADAT